MNLLDLMVKIGVDDQATSRIGGIASAVGNGLGSAAKIGAAAVAATGAAATGAATALAGAASQVAQYGDNVDKMSQKMGMSAESYQEWDAVMQHSGTSMETMKASMKTLANAAETGNEAFQRLGLSQEQIANMSQEELFEATISGLQNVSDTTERTYLAGQLMGRGATELGALLNTSAEDTQAMRDRVHELGGVMSDDAVKASARFQDSLQDMQTALSGLKRNAMAEFLPGMATVMDGLGNIFSGNTGEGADQVSEGIGQLVEKVREAVPKIVEVVRDIAPSVLNALVEIVAAIAQELPSVIAGLIPVLIDMAPTIIEAAFQMFLGIVQALSEAGPELISKMVDVIFEIANMLVEYAPQILEASMILFAAIGQALMEKLPDIAASLIELLANLASAIIEHVPEFLEAALNLVLGLVEGFANGLVPMMGAVEEVVNGALEAVGAFFMGMFEAGAELVSNIAGGIADAARSVWDAVAGAVKDAVDGVGEFFSRMFDAGVDMINGLVQGLTNAPTIVLDTLVGMAQGAVDGFLGFFGIASPSKRMRGYGRNIMDGLALGIADRSADVEAAMLGISDMLGSVPMTVGMSSPLSLQAAAPAGFRSGDVYNIYVTSREGEDVAVRIRNELHAYNLTRGR